MKKIYYIILSSLTLLFPFFVSAQYKTLVNIPGIESADNVSMDEFVNAIYALSISIAALLAVIKIVIAGVKWMVTDVVTTKGDAKKDIQGALFGLLVILAAVLILFIINPNITNVDLGINQARVAPAASLPPSSNADPALVAIQGMNDYERNKCAGNGSCATEIAQCEITGRTYHIYELPNPTPRTEGNYIACGMDSPVIGCSESTARGATGFNCDGAEDTCEDRGDVVVTSNETTGEVVCRETVTEILNLECDFTDVSTRRGTRRDYNCTSKRAECENDLGGAYFGTNDAGTLLYCEVPL